MPRLNKKGEVLQPIFYGFQILSELFGLISITLSSICLNYGLKVIQYYGTKIIKVIPQKLKENIILLKPILIANMTLLGIMMLLGIPMFIRMNFYLEKKPKKLPYLILLIFNFIILISIFILATIILVYFSRIKFDFYEKCEQISELSDYVYIGELSQIFMLFFSVLFISSNSLYFLLVYFYNKFINKSLNELSKDLEAIKGEYVKNFENFSEAPSSVGQKSDYQLIIKKHIKSNLADSKTHLRCSTISSIDQSVCAEDKKVKDLFCQTDLKFMKDSARYIITLSDIDEEKENIPQKCDNENTRINKGKINEKGNLNYLNNPKNLPLKYENVFSTIQEMPEFDEIATTTRGGKF